MACRGRILIVDDDRDTREALSEFVRAVGCRADVACDGLAGLGALERGVPPCLVLVDVTMPRLGGEEFVRRVRRTPLGADLTVVSMSAGDRRLRPPLVDRHLAKPFGLDELWPTIERCCRATVRIEAEGAPAPLS